MRRLAAALLAASLPGARAAAAEEAWRDVPRKVLALYDSRRVPGGSKDIFFHPLHQHAELPLNHLGLDLEYVDISRPLPGPEAFRQARGVIAWFDSPQALEDPGALCSWLDGAMRRGLRVVLVGQLGLYSSATPPYALSPPCRAALKTLGLWAQGYRSVDPLAVSLSRADARVVGFERRPDASESGVIPLAGALPGATAYLRVDLADSPPPAVEPVVVGPRGGAALDPFFLYVNQDLPEHAFKWITDPFAFFERAFALQGLPRPDVTTLSGRRVYMSRVDGDGFFNASEIGKRRLSGEVFLKEILERYPRSPFTVSLIAGYYDIALYRTEESLELSRKVLSLPNVEPASHGYAHPLVWRTGKLAVAVPGYAMDSRKEIVDSGRIIAERVLRGERPVRLFLWTGDCLPSERELAMAQEAGLLQINGGGGRFDSAHDSVSHLLPIGRGLGAARQIYAAVSNENEFTELWSARYYGYRDVLETFARTESPRRLKPVDVYVHFYSAERYASLRALQGVYDWAQRQPLIPILSGRYARSARDFFALRVQTLGPRRFRLLGGRDVRTVRFDAPSLWPDMSASRGLVGWRREGASLYVSLDDQEEREIALSPAPGGGARIEEASFEASRWAARGGGVRFSYSGWGTPEFTLAGLSAGRDYRVAEGGRRLTVRADSTGRLKARLEATRAGLRAGEISVEPL